MCSELQIYETWLPVGRDGTGMEVQQSCGITSHLFLKTKSDKGKFQHVIFIIKYSILKVNILNANMKQI
jgi:hypothetical protein